MPTKEVTVEFTASMQLLEHARYNTLKEVTIVPIQFHFHGDSELQELQRYNSVTLLYV